ncbi:DNA mismatch repair protein PMS2 [Nematocida displodere]|uniref:DNA mismatch repair protein PMS2 n=1 Tax=Nematocida displodere TaxID=1805483 RepID=A0A177EE27_9MICR|nr:DNA mismatch repair protein PMS2 [Nematocida displodere]
MRIEVLPEETASLISVSQIIPDPYVLLKELIENSLDSGATTIKVGIHGEDVLQYVVQDDGTGINVNEHFLKLGGTSKKDRTTYGCKGVALYGITQLADVQITTKTAADAKKVTATNGAVRIEPCFKPEQGTTTRVTNFHKAFPVRYTYILKTIQAYLRDIVTLCKKYVITHKVRFTVERNSKVIYTCHRVPECPTQRLIAAYEVSESHGLVQVLGSSFRLSMVLSPPHRSKLDGASQKPGAFKVEGVIYAGGKIIESAKVAAELAAIAKQFSSKVYFHMEILQVHPDENTLHNIGTRSNKHHRLIYKEVLLLKSLEELRVGGHLDHKVSPQHAKPISSFISGTETIYTATIDHAQATPITAPSQTSVTAPPHTPVNAPSQTPVTAPKPNPNSKILAYTITNTETFEVKEYTEGMRLQKEDLLSLKTIGQFNNSFILAALQKPMHTLMYAIDQHSADEAVKYEHLKNTYTYTKQKLIRPLAVNLSEYERYLVEENKDTLERHGFILSPANTEVLEVPLYGKHAFGEEELKEVLESISEGGKERVLFKSLRGILASKACRSSVMIGDPLTEQQMKDILSKLGQTTRPWNCPHGRPTIVLLQSHKSPSTNPSTQIQ